MSSWPHRLSAGALVATFILSTMASAQNPTVSEVVSQMQAFYEKTQDLKGKFKQVFIDTLYDKHRTSYGYLYVRKPGMMRWNYVTPERKAFIADGKELWVWEPEDKQAFRNPLNTNNLSTGLTFLLGKGDLTKEFDITFSDEKLGAPEDRVLKLTPKKATPQYTHILLSIHPRDFSVGESMVVSKHNRNHLIFTSLEINTQLNKSRFQFVPPADTRVIDGSKLGQGQ
jgi:outer membrane lipoprotein carrier protein